LSVDAIHKEEKKEMNGKDTFIKYLKDKGLNDKEANQVLNVYLDMKVGKFNSIGQFQVINGQYLDNKPLTRALLHGRLQDRYGHKIDNIEYKTVGNITKAQVHCPAGVPAWVLKEWSDAHLFIDYEGYLTLSESYNI